MHAERHFSGAKLVCHCKYQQYFGEDADGWVLFLFSFQHGIMSAFFMDKKLPIKYLFMPVVAIGDR